MTLLKIFLIVKYKIVTITSSTSNVILWELHLIVTLLKIFNLHCKVKVAITSSTSNVILQELHLVVTLLKIFFIASYSCNNNINNKQCNPLGITSRCDLIFSKVLKILWMQRYNCFFSKFVQMNVQIEKKN